MNVSTVSATAEITGVPVERVWDIVATGPAAEHVLAVHRRADGQAEWSVLLSGGRVAWVQRETAQPPLSLRFEQTRGDFDTLHGRWTLRPGPAAVTVRLEIGFHLGVDGLAPLLDPIWTHSFQAHADALVRAVVRESEPT